MSWRDKIAAVLAGKVGGPTPTGIHVYHSSPHDFDRFDLSKIGTGEGAQVYGHGIYAAENPAVSGQGGQYWQSFQHKMPFAEFDAAKMLQKHGFDREQASKQLRDAIERGEMPYNTTTEQFNAYRWNQALKLLEGDKPVGPRTYEVNFRAKPEELLDWDKPIAAQAPGTREALARLGVPDAPHVKGEQAYWHLKGDMLQKYGHRDPNLNAAYTSQVLNEAGIPGIRYLDEGSRLMPQRREALENTLKIHRADGKLADVAEYENLLANMKPTHNYVAFDPSKLDIMAKYGVVGGVPLGALAATDQYEAQP